MIYHGNFGKLDDLPETIGIVVKRLEPQKNDFDSIVCMGMSGVIVAIPVALALDKPFVIVRKEGESYHHDEADDRGIVNKKRIGRRTLFLDDFSSAGITYNTVGKAVNDFTNARIVGQYYYRMHYCNIKPKRKYTRKGA